MSRPRPGLVSVCGAVLIRRRVLELLVTGEWWQLRTVRKQLTVGPSTLASCARALAGLGLVERRPGLLRITDAGRQALEAT